MISKKALAAIQLWKPPIPSRSISLSCSLFDHNWVGNSFPPQIKLIFNLHRDLPAAWGPWRPVLPGLTPVCLRATCKFPGRPADRSLSVFTGNCCLDDIGLIFSNICIGGFCLDGICCIGRVAIDERKGLNFRTNVSRKDGSNKWWHCVAIVSFHAL